MRITHLLLLQLLAALVIFLAICFRPTFERILSPGFGCCKKCNRPWTFVEGHKTPYSRGRACFPLCENCWQGMTPEKRLPYYRKLWLEWKEFSDRDGHALVDWEVIKKACLKEGEFVPDYWDSVDNKLSKKNPPKPID